MLLIEMMADKEETGARLHGQMKLYLRLGRMVESGSLEGLMREGALIVYGQYIGQGGQQ